jgi:hypothetical protein
MPNSYLVIDFTGTILSVASKRLHPVYACEWVDDQARFVVPRK